MKVMDLLARGTGPRTEPLFNWQPQAAHTAKQLWSVW
jgi:hypothetical protein